jgi:hypothetical protein
MRRECQASQYIPASTRRISFSRPKSNFANDLSYVVLATLTLYMGTAMKEPRFSCRPASTFLKLHPQFSIGLLAVLARLVPWALLHVLQYLPSFDSSALLVSGPLGSSSLRWDAIHFVSIAKEGYRYEQQIAFQPGWPLLLRGTSSVARKLGWTGLGDIRRIVKLGEAGACVFYVGSAVMLYRCIA